MRYRNFVLCLAGVSSIPLDLWGQDQPELITDRPDFTESVVTVPAGSVQLESGYTFAHAGGLDEHSVGELLVRVSLLDRLELRAGLNSYVWVRNGSETQSGLEDTSLGFKARLMDEGEGEGLHRPGAAVILATSVPTGTATFRGTTWDPEVSLGVGWTLSERTALTSNLTLALPMEDGDRYRQMSGSVSLGRSLTGRSGVYLEVFGFSPLTGGGSDAAYVNAGLTHLLLEGFQLDVRAGTRVGVSGPDYFLGAGFAHRWLARSR